VAKFVKGDVVVVPFPFSDLTQAKRRPTLIVSVLEGDDLILSQVTSQFVKDSYAVSIDVKDFEEGGLKQKSNVRPNRLFTADGHIVLYRIGNLKRDKMNEIVEKIIEIIRR